MRYLPTPSRQSLRPTWRAARPTRIDRALALALAKNAGGWLVAGASREIGTRRSVTRVIDGREVALWRRADGDLVAGQGACPHFGALLDGCEVRASAAVCRWHGMSVGPEAGQGWQAFAAYDDGVLVWVQLPGSNEVPTPAPVLPPRPALGSAISAVICVPGRCEPRDILANRLDPWHGAWFHPYAFSHLRVDESASTDERLVVEVAYRVTRSWAEPVIAAFECPDRRTIVMTIVSGEGTGSVVETHATPLGPDRDGCPRTMMTEATIAASPHSGFQLARRVSPLVEAGIRHAARRLWVDDLAYAERRYELRRRGQGQV